MIKFVDLARQISRTDDESVMIFEIACARVTERDKSSTFICYSLG